MVAVGLMAIMMSMIATIFLQATNAFRSARASVEIHRSAGAILTALENDLAGVEFCTYGGTQGYFALSKEEDRDPADGTPFDLEALTFTTLAPQPGARYAAPEVIQQLALVRYQLIWDGGSAQLTGANQAPRPTYRLVKRVRFPHTDDAGLDMTEFDPANLPIEIDPKDPAAASYAAPEPLGFGLLSMKLRVYSRPINTATAPPAWQRLVGNDPPPLEFNNRPPVMVEATLEITDQRAVKMFTFTERFFIPASERNWNP
jgi:hypothetical protein